MIINVSEAKTHVSRYIDMVYHGEEVIIIDGETKCDKRRVR